MGDTSTNKNKHPPWADLPTELLTTISTHCFSSNPLDLLSFRSVCTTWHSSSLLPSSSLSPLFPLSLPSPPPPPLFIRYFSRNDSVVLSLTTIFLLHPPTPNGHTHTPYPWLLFLDQLNPGKVSVRRPFTKWSYDIPLDFPRRLDLLQFGATALGQFYNLSSVHTRRGTGADVGALVRPNIWSDDVLKVVFLSNVLVAFVLFQEGKLGLLRLGIGNEGAQWENVHEGKGFRFDDIVEFKGKVLGVDRRGRVYEVCIFDNETKVNVIFPPITGGGGRRKRLVESLGRLYLVVRCSTRGKGEEATAFKVYELNEETKKWVEVTSIGDRILFFGLDFSLSVSAEVLRGCLGRNCIIFKFHSFEKYNGGDDDQGLVYSLEKSDLRIGVWHFNVAPRVSAIRSFPDYSSVLWPPPPWIWSDDVSKRVGFLHAAIDRLLTRTADEIMKAQFIKLSPLLAAVASYGSNNFNKRDVVGIMLHSEVLIHFMNDIAVVIDNELQRIENNLLEEAVMRRRQINSTTLVDQVDTPYNGSKERDDCSDSTQTSTEDGWLAREWKRRLGTHKEVDALLKCLGRILEENSSQFEEFRKSQEHVSAAAETGSSKSK